MKIKENNLITFIIVNYRSKKSLIRCLNDLSKINNAKKCEIIIINNDTVELSLKKQFFPQQSIINIGKNIGYGRANNLGLRQATGKFICFLNPDTHSFCANFTQITQELKNKMLASPKIKTECNNIEKWSVGKKFDLYEILKNKCSLNEKLWLSDKKCKVGWVSGAALIGSRKFLLDLNGFDEEFFLYFEDVDLCKRAIDRGGQIYYIPEYHLTHTNGVSSKNDVQKQKKYYYASQELFFKKHCSSIQTNILKLCHHFYLS